MTEEEVLREEESTREQNQNRIVGYEISKLRNGKYYIKYYTELTYYFIGIVGNTTRYSGVKLFDTPTQAKQALYNRTNNPFDLIEVVPLEKYKESKYHYRIAKFRNGLFTLQMDRTEKFGPYTGWFFITPEHKHTGTQDFRKAELFSTVEEVREFYLSIVQNPFDTIEMVEKI